MQFVSNCRSPCKRDCRSRDKVPSTFEASLPIALSLYQRCSTIGRIAVKSKYTIVISVILPACKDLSPSRLFIDIAELSNSNSLSFCSSNDSLNYSPSNLSLLCRFPSSCPLQLQFSRKISPPKWRVAHGLKPIQLHRRGLLNPRQECENVGYTPCPRFIIF